MDTDKCLDEAKKWVEANDSLKIVKTEDDKRKIVFGIGDTEFSFYIIEPQPSGNSAWMIWSDFENVLAHLSDVQDLSSSKSISEVLKAVKTAIQPLVSESKEDDDDAEMGDEDDDDDYDYDQYYGEDDVEEENDKEKQKAESDDEDLEENFFTGGGNPAAIQRLSKDLKSFKKGAEMFGIAGGPRGDNLFVWDIQLKDIPESKLARDLNQYANKYKTEPFINIEMMFPSDYPMSPPFVRVITPRFKFLTGHITIGGSICMEMLTKSGWRPTNDIENILVQIRCEILSDPNAQLDLNNANSAYTIAEAKDAFKRMVQRYGWDK